jgi:hypothetical protein
MTLGTVLGAMMAVLILGAPVLVLSPIIDSIFEIVQMRAIVRRVFRIDAGATVANVPERSRPTP